MMLRGLSPLAALAAGIGILLLSGSAMAAISVIGNPVARDCYNAAEFGGNPDNGIAVCNTALSGMAMAVKDRAATYINRGILKSRNNDPDGALEDYNHGISLDGSLGEGYVDRGATYIVLKDYDAALTDIDKGISLGAKKPEIAYYDRAIVDEATGNIRAAYEDYRKAVEIQPDFPLAVQALTRFRVIRKGADGT